MTIQGLRHMGQAVLLRAFNDLRSSGTTTFNDHGRVAVNAKEEAQLFLTAATPEWQESLETWCAIAGYDPNEIVRRASTFVRHGAII